MTRKKAKTIRKTETGIWPGHMLKRLAMLFDAARKSKNFFNVKWPKTSVGLLQRPCQQTDKSNIFYHARSGSI